MMARVSRAAIESLFPPETSKKRRSQPTTSGRVARRTPPATSSTSTPRPSSPEKRASTASSASAACSRSSSSNSSSSLVRGTGSGETKRVASRAPPLVEQLQQLGPRYRLGGDEEDRLQSRLHFTPLGHTPIASRSTSPKSRV